ncbi:MAG: stage II sporulation protein R [Firmicutes bacterium]|nr:stage II sporulation protein R [Bacillota bacterium]
MFRYRLAVICLLVIIFGIIGCLGSGFARIVEPFIETYNRNNLIRLHVVADGNSPEAQQLKLKVRDKIIEITEPLLIKIEHPVEAERILRSKLPLFEKTARQIIQANGLDMDVKVSLEQFTFPEIAYPFGQLPAGEYKGLKVILGSGEGKNWWCVLYPPLCLLDPDAPTFKSSQAEPPQEVEYRLAILEELIKGKDLSLNSFWKEWGRFFGLI